MFAQRILARAAPRMRLARQPIRQQKQKYSSGSPAPKQFLGAEDNEFNRERAHIKEHAAESGELWRKLTVYLALPCLLIALVNGKLRWDAHWEHVAHLPPPDHPEYSYQNIRTKNYFWGDGDKTIFWNSKVNSHRKADADDE